MGNCEETVGTVKCAGRREQFILDKYEYVQQSLPEFNRDAVSAGQGDTQARVRFHRAVGGGRQPGSHHPH